MRILGKATRSLPLALIAASLMIGTGSARAEREGSLFDALFGGIRYKPRNVDPRKVFPDAPRPRKAVAAPRVTGPSYYNYKADPLVRVDFAALRAAPEKITFEPSPAGQSISDAAAGLDGFDLFAEKDVAKAISDYYSANPQFIWVTDQTRQREGAGGDSPARLGRQLRAVSGRLFPHRSVRGHRWRRWRGPHDRIGAL